MFRDETVKVRKKFEESGTDGSTATASSSTIATIPSTTTAITSTAPETAATFIKTEAAPEIPEAEATSSAIDETDNNAGQVTTSQGHNELATTNGSGADGSFSLSEALAAFGGTLGNNGNPITSGKGSPLSLARKQQRRRQGGAALLTSDMSVPPTSPVDLSIEAQSALVKSMLYGPGQTLFERGLQFYMDHYLYGHPESPTKTGVIEVDTPWILDPAARTIASAVGMAGIANLNGDDQIQISAYQNYVTGLQMTARTLASPGLDTINNVMRSIILMAMFEVGSMYFLSVFLSFVFKQHADLPHV